MASQIEIHVTPVPAVDLARQYVETWVLQAEGAEGTHRSEEGVRRRWLVWAHSRQITPFVHFLGVFDFQTEADSVAETIWLGFQETPLKADVCVGVAAVYAEEQSRRFIRSWIGQMEGLVLGMKSGVDTLRTRSIEEMERRLAATDGMAGSEPALSAMRIRDHGSHSVGLPLPRDDGGDRAVSAARYRTALRSRRVCG